MLTECGLFQGVVVIIAYAIAVILVFVLVIVWLIHRHINLRMVDEFLSKEECRYLIDLATYFLEKDHQRLGENPSRTSTPIFLDSEDEVVRDIRIRAARFLNVPEGYVETLQVVRYTLTQEYRRHVDWFPVGKSKLQHPTGKSEFTNIPYQRQTTILVYLNDVARGGETYFPYLGKKITPRLGTAVCWNNLWPNGMGNRLVLHAAMPVTRGKKWAVNIWVGNRDIAEAYRDRANKGQDQPA